jgi:MAF protein
MDNLTQPPSLILASSSRYRRDLLQRLTGNFSCQTPAIDESRMVDEGAVQMVRRLAEAKARAVAEAGHSGLIIGSDQAAVMDGQIIGKPGSHAAAVRQLQQASNNELLFVTGVSVFNSLNGRLQVDCVPCKVRFRTLSESLIERYLQRERPYDCAGAFKSEGLGIALLDSMETSDPTALIGLPLIRLTRMLEAEGFAVI